MICYVDLEHPELGPSMLSERPGSDPAQGRPLDVQGALRAPERHPCLLLHFTQVDRAWLERLGVRAVVVSGHSTLIDDYDPRDLAPLVELIRETTDPVLGLCGGHQLIGARLRRDAGADGPARAGRA